MDNNKDKAPNVNSKIEYVGDGSDNPVIKGGNPNDKGNNLEGEYYFYDEVKDVFLTTDNNLILYKK